MTTPTYTFPSQPGLKRFIRPPKPVFFNTNNPMVPPPIGCLPMQVEGGGRYDGDPITPGWQEDSFWVGGYNGPNDDIIEEKVKACFMNPMYTPGFYYCFNVEHWTTDARSNKDVDVEVGIRRFRKFFLTAQKYRPDMRWGVYSVIPNGDYWTPTHYETGMLAYNVWKSGQPMTAQNNHDAYGVANWNNGVWTLDESCEWTAAFRKWQKANDRLAVGYDDKGVKQWDWGLTDCVDYLAPSAYDFYVGDDSEAYVKWNVSESRRIGGNRPVYPFVWPCYHDSNPDVGGKTIPIPEFTLQVRRVLKYGDGAVIWGADSIAHAEHIRVVLDEAERAVSGRAV